MIFKGTPLSQVKWKDRIIVIFNDDGSFETEDSGVIQRLQMLDFKGYEPVASLAEGIPTEPTAGVELEAPVNVSEEITSSDEVEVIPEATSEPQADVTGEMEQSEAIGVSEPESSEPTASEKPKKGKKK